jgi:hypothetical protein
VFVGGGSEGSTGESADEQAASERAANHGNDEFTLQERNVVMA